MRVTLPSHYVYAEPLGRANLVSAPSRGTAGQQPLRKVHESFVPGLDCFNSRLDGRICQGISVHGWLSSYCDFACLMDIRAALLLIGMLTLIWTLPANPDICFSTTLAVLKGKSAVLSALANVLQRFRWLRTVTRKHIKATATTNREAAYRETANMFPA